MKKKFERNSKFHEDYIQFMDKIISNGYAERIPESDIDRRDGKVWYIPHHGVYHPHKPNKILTRGWIES